MAIQVRRNVDNCPVSSLCPRKEMKIMIEYLIPILITNEDFHMKKVLTTSSFFVLGLFGVFYVCTFFVDAHSGRTDYRVVTSDDLSQICEAPVFPT